MWRRPPPPPSSPPACSFQSPVEIPGVSNIDFLRVATNARRAALALPELDPLEFYAHVSPKVGREMGGGGHTLHQTGGCRLR